VTSAHIAAKVEAARVIQHARGFYSAHIPVRVLRSLCTLDDAGERTLEMAARRMGLSARAHDRILEEGHYDRRSGGSAAVEIDFEQAALPNPHSQKEVAMERFLAHLL